MDRKLVRLIGLAVLSLTLAAAWAQTPPAVRRSPSLPSPASTPASSWRPVRPWPPLAASYSAAGSPAELQIEFGPGQLARAARRSRRRAPAGQGLRVETQSQRPLRAHPDPVREGPLPDLPGRRAGRSSSWRRSSAAAASYLIAPDVEKALAGPARPRSRLGPAGRHASRPAGWRSPPAWAGRRSPTSSPWTIRCAWSSTSSTPSTTARRKSGPIGQFGVEAVRVGQFMSGSPYTITRLVFDLREARAFYAGRAAPTGSGSDSASRARPRPGRRASRSAVAGLRPTAGRGHRRRQPADRQGPATGGDRRGRRPRRKPKPARPRAEPQSPSPGRSPDRQIPAQDDRQPRAEILRRAHQPQVQGRRPPRRHPLPGRVRRPERRLRPRGPGHGHLQLRGRPLGPVPGHHPQEQQAGQDARGQRPAHRPDQPS